MLVFRRIYTACLEKHREPHFYSFINNQDKTFLWLIAKRNGEETITVNNLLADKLASHFAGATYRYENIEYQG